MAGSKSDMGGKSSVLDDLKLKLWLGLGDHEAVEKFNETTQTKTNKNKKHTTKLNKQKQKQTKQTKQKQNKQDKPKPNKLKCEACKNMCSWIMVLTRPILLNHDSDQKEGR